MLHPLINDIFSFEHLGPGDYLTDISYLHWVILSQFGISKNTSL